jgi:hypothetical protein
MTINVPPP